MTAVDDLVTWLREQIAADEAVATEATEGPWTDHLGQVLGGPDAQQLVADRAQVWNSDHITRWNPVRVLAQCEAHTALLAEHRRYDEWEREYNAQTPGLSGRPVHPDPSCVGCGNDFDEEPRTKHVNECPTLRALALAYQHRPGYREAWRP